MQAFVRRLDYLFASTTGLTLVAITLIGLVTAVFGTLSGPMAELGLKDIVVRVLGMQLVEAEREARIIMLYHVIAMAVIAIETYFITAIVPMKKTQQANINTTITFGYITALVFGLLFAYFGGNFIFHGLFLFGLSLVFFAGLLLAKALWPWGKEYRQTSPDYARTRGGIDLERAAFFTMAVCTLGSALFGAVPGSMFGNGFESFLAEDIVREPHKTPLQLSVIGHLHIMLTLIAVALLLVLVRWVDFRGWMHKISMPLIIAGSIIVTLGVWLVVPFEEIAHIIIYVGSVVLMPAALLLVIYAWRKLIRDRFAALNIKKWGFWQGVGALLHDPLKFGAFWQMVYMNFVVTFVGIFMAIRLDKTMRAMPWREERILLTGHWHILAGIIATIILLYYTDLTGIKGKARQLFGWLVIVGSDLAFAAVTLFATKRLYVTESAQQPLVNATMLLTDAGLILVLLVLAAFLAYRLVDLFRGRGRWAKELAESEATEVSR
ncbi:MAG: hypothetical protein N3E40_00320 [Dehalococcoidia bacterium]|nr:hypothetical protein [Dehalococcoidia bacterium]